MADFAPEASQSREPPSDLQGLLAIGATYVYFLIWAQFGLLARMRASGLDASEIRLVMAAMGVAGVAASWGAARLPSGRRSVAGGLLLCALTGLGSLFAEGGVAYAIAAAAVGAATALTTVSLSASLPQLVAPRRRGLGVGLATGAAYFACNLPWVFEGGPERQASVAALGCAVAAIALLRPPFSRSRTSLPAAVAPPDSTPLASAIPPRFAWAAVVGLFLALVWLDSAAFAIIQDSELLRERTWALGTVKIWIGLAHLAAALLAGVAIDRGRLLRLPFVAFVLLAIAALALERLTSGLAAGLLYAAGVSLYSVPLVVAPTAAAFASSRSSPGVRAATLYGVAGWIGSAAGIGMAQDLHRIPGAFLLAAALVLVVAALGLSTEPARWLRRLGPTTGVALAGTLLALFWPDPARPAGVEAAATRGRAVYVSEGCVHCHSQFVRPNRPEALAWGPARPLDRHETPPLIGNRRQGPDLAAVGLRRNPVWNRLHLEDPRAFLPTSRMPSYAYLFADRDRRGGDLVEYLASLGAGDGGLRAADLAGAAKPAMDAASAAPGHADRDRYVELCAVCHGESGRGDGPYARHFAPGALDLTKARLRWTSNPADPADDGRDLQRLVQLLRWGAPGTAMAGHESLPEPALAGLAQVVVAFGETDLSPEASSQTNGIEP